MFAAFLDMLKGTPWWVGAIFGWVIFIYLMYRGIKSRNSYTISILAAPILPVVVLLWFIMPIFFQYENPPAVLPYFILGLAAGIFLGFFVLYQNITINRATHQITFEGSWLPLYLLMSIFVVKYAFGYMHAIQHDFIVVYPWAELVCSGFIAGIFQGRLLKVYHQYMKA